MNVKHKTEIKSQICLTKQARHKIVYSFIHELGIVLIFQTRALSFKI